MIKVVLCGAAGKMGRAIIRELVKSDDVRLVGAIEAPDNPAVGSDAGLVAGTKSLGVQIVGTQKLERIIKKTKPDVLVDFTVAHAAVKNVKIAAKHGVQIVVGTTGFTKEQLEEIENAVKESGVTAVLSPNMSVGMNVLFELVKEAAKLLGKEYSVEIIEIHHKEKRDAPSGTALRIAEILSKEMGGLRIIVGRTSEEKREGIYIHSLRIGDVTGEHTVIFAGQGERLEITHKAHGRETFAAGVLRAVRFAYKHRKMGKICDMWDVLGLR
ncbi:MAG: 4-hydroxy-tetrahydrodipicolinate reductase [Candidatus Hadarchaeales archaeon]